MKIFQLLSLALILVFLVACEKETKATELIQQWEIKRGINISHWLSQNGKKETGADRYAGIGEKDFETIATAGFDHIRLPIDEKELWTESGEKIPYTFGLLHDAIAWCKKYNMRVLVDLHIIRSHHFNSESENTLFTNEEAQLQLLKLWRDLSDELKQYSNGFLAYELMNEPVAPEHELWNKLIERMVTQIRVQEPERKIFIGSNRWQGLDFLQDLVLPANDKNLVISFHFYEPFLLTHYQASWMPEMQIPCNVSYPGRIISEEDEKLLTEEQKKGIAWTMGTFDSNFLDQRISIAVKRAKELGLPLYCGEFGCISPNVPVDSRENWYKDITAVFEKYDIPYTAWDYKGSFKVFNSDYTPANSIILEALSH